MGIMNIRLVSGLPVLARVGTGPKVVNFGRHSYGRSGFHPPAFWLVAVSTAVGTGTWDVFPQSEPVVLQERTKSEVEPFAIVDGVETRLESFSQLLVAGLRDRCVCH